MAALYRSYSDEVRENDECEPNYDQGNHVRNEVRKNHEGQYADERDNCILLPTVHEKAESD